MRKAAEDLADEVALCRLDLFRGVEFFFSAAPFVAAAASATTRDQRQKSARTVARQLTTKSVTRGPIRQHFPSLVAAPHAFVTRNGSTFLFGKTQGSSQKTGSAAHEVVQSRQARVFCSLDENRGNNERPET